MRDYSMVDKSNDTTMPIFVGHISSEVMSTIEFEEIWKKMTIYAPIMEFVIDSSRDLSDKKMDIDGGCWYGRDVWMLEADSESQDKIKETIKNLRRFFEELG